jgi:uncharacterized membrane protein
MRQVLAFITLFITAIVIDLAWFTAFASAYYIEAIGGLLHQSENGVQVDLASTAIVYFLMVLGIMLFVLPRAQRKSGKAALWGGIYGMIIYGIYDFTNHAILNGWPLRVSLVDLGWGIIFCVILSMLAVFLQKRWNF